MVPYVLVFWDVYMKQDSNGDWKTFDKTSENLYKIELAIDIIMCVDIALNFLKKSLAATKIDAIAKKYITSYFIFDILPVVICLS